MVIVLELPKYLLRHEGQAGFNDFIYKIRRRLDDTLPMKIRMLSRWYENLLEVTRNCVILVMSESLVGTDLGSSFLYSSRNLAII